MQTYWRAPPSSYWRVPHSSVGEKEIGEQWIWMQGNQFKFTSISQYLSTLQMHNPLHLRILGFYHMDILIYMQNNIFQNYFYTIVYTGKRQNSINADQRKHSLKVILYPIHGVFYNHYIEWEGCGIHLYGQQNYCLV